MAARKPANHWLPAWWHNPQAKRGSWLLLAALLVSILGPWLAPHAPAEMVGPVYGMPQGLAVFGYDFLGHDVLSRVLAGGWSILWMSFASAALALMLGSLLGVLAGFSRQRLDQAITWLADVALAFPDFILVLLIIAMFGRDPWLIVSLVSLTLTPSVIRLARSSTVSMAGQEFVEVAQMMGFSKRHIILREILPNILTPLLVHFGNMLTWAVGLLAGLSFLGYGVAPPAADWGLMINENRTGLLVQPWAVLAPALMVAWYAYAANILAEGISRSHARVAGAAHE